MAGFSWAAPVSGDWNAASGWIPAAVPNDALADVTIDNPTVAEQPSKYAVKVKRAAD